MELLQLLGLLGVPPFLGEPAQLVQASDLALEFFCWHVMTFHVLVGHGRLAAVVRGLPG